MKTTTKTAILKAEKIILELRLKEVEQLLLKAKQNEAIQEQSSSN